MRWSVRWRAYAILFCLKPLLIIGCAFEPTVTEDRPSLTAEGQQLLNQMEGRWSLQVTLAGDCPSAWRRGLPSGQVVFHVDNGALQISAQGSGVTEFIFYPVDGDTLTYSTTVAAAGCSAQETAELEVESLGNSSVQGMLHVDLRRADTPACDAFLDDTDLPSSCRTTTTFTGIRLSPAPGS
jgi:hypothetical protein